MKILNKTSTFLHIKASDTCYILHIGVEVNVRFLKIENVPCHCQGQIKEPKMKFIHGQLTTPYEDKI